MPIARLLLSLVREASREHRRDPRDFVLCTSVTPRSAGPRIYAAAAVTPPTEVLSPRSLGPPSSPRTDTQRHKCSSIRLVRGWRFMGTLPEASPALRASLEVRVEKLLGHTRRCLVRIELGGQQLVVGAERG